jgi:RNA polymerase sigma-70 factor, ECF subfamily
MSATQQGVTQLLVGARKGEQSALAALTAAVYDELRGLAGAYLTRERRGHTLQPTALVNEAFLALMQGPVEAKDRAHFFAIAANVMRRVLVDHARTRGAAKRGGGKDRVELHSAVAIVPEADVEVLALDEAMQRLAALDERQARIVELRFFGNLTVDEVAEVVGVSKRTVESDWTLARAWLHRELTGRKSGS